MNDKVDKRVKSLGNEDLTKVNLVTEKLKFSLEKSARSSSKSVTTALSGLNIVIPCVMFFIHSTAKASILLGSSITSFVLGIVSIMLNTYSLINNFKERKLIQAGELEEKRKQELIKENKKKLESIFWDISCDVMFLCAAIASVTLLGNFATIPLLVGGCALMVMSICITYCHKSEEFISLSSEETEEIKDKHKEKVQKSLVYRTISKVVPETLLLVNLHQQEKSQQMKEELKSIKQLLRDKKSEVEREQNDKTICSGEEKEGNKGKEDKVSQNLLDVEVKGMLTQESITC